MMKSKLQYCSAAAAGFAILLCVCVSVHGQRDFLFPDEFRDLQSRGDFLESSDDYEEPGFPQSIGLPQQPASFQEEDSSQQEQAFQQNIYQEQSGFLQEQSAQQGVPAQLSESSTTTTTTPATPLTTRSPAFLACMANCPTTSEYNPICGTDRQLYFNQQKYDCAVSCGAKVEIWRRGSCEGLFAMMRG